MVSEQKAVKAKATSTCGKLIFISPVDI